MHSTLPVVIRGELYELQACLQQSVDLNKKITASKQLLDQQHVQDEREWNEKCTALQNTIVNLREQLLEHQIFAQKQWDCETQEEIRQQQDMV